MLSLDVEYGTSGSGQILTRVQAFLEMLEARRK
jgi:benzoyl-CoA reductase/2-hydroxyglutaryl-CoA dehydratase subunit BcrC/BadD/HgdB